MRAAKLKGVVKVALSLLEDRDSLKALVRWPKFSVSSYFMVARLLRQGIEPHTVLDVGANTGQFAVASSKLFPGARVHSFEPVPECVDELRENVSGLDVAVYPLGLGQQEGQVSFHVNSHSHSSSALPLANSHRESFPEAREERTIEVEVSTLDRVFEGVELERPVLIKLDVQGYEARVLRGGEETLKRADYVVLETSFKPMYEGEKTFMDLARMMEGYGFRFERPVGWLSSPKTGEILQMDALFVRE
jgi:FkbM family methyltransferase